MHMSQLGFRLIDHLGNELGCSDKTCNSFDLDPSEKYFSGNEAEAAEEEIPEFFEGLSTSSANQENPDTVSSGATLTTTKCAMLKQCVSCSATSEETPVPLASTLVPLPVPLPSYVSSSESSVTSLQQDPLPTYASVLFQAPLRDQDPEAPEERSARGGCSPDQGSQLLNGAL